jgi:hypothetical protein
MPLMVACACRESRHTTGSPIAFNACQCQVDKGPLSSPMRTTSRALDLIVSAMASGVDRHFPCQTIFPSLLMTQRWVISCDTSKPTNCSIVASMRIIEGKTLAAPAITPCQHSVAAGATRDRLPPARGAVFASGMEAGWRRKRSVSVHDSPTPAGETPQEPQEEITYMPRHDA